MEFLLSPGGRVLLGAASASTGAALTKLWCERGDAKVAERLREVHRHACISAPIGLDLVAAVHELLAILESSLSAENHGSCCGGLEFFTDRFSSNPRPGGSHSQADVEYKRRLRRIRELSGKAPHRRETRGGSSQSAINPWLQYSRVLTAESRSHARRREARDRLFDPSHGGVSGQHGACSALCYLVASFLQLGRSPRGTIQDSQRASLRLAVTALALHPVFGGRHSLARQRCTAMGVRLLSSPRATSTNEDFQRWATALICFLDAALAWRPIDPFGLLGTGEEGEHGMLLVGNLGICSYGTSAKLIQTHIRKANNECGATWRRLEAQMEQIRMRNLPLQWQVAWSQAQDASMLVRNRTRAQLRVELHHHPLRVSPWADWPLMRNYFQPRPVIVANVNSGIEWAFRPNIREGFQFHVRLLTKAGVEVASRRLRRGQKFNFRVPVPPEPSVQLRGQAKPSGKGAPKHRLSTCSTAAPSSSSASAHGDALTTTATEEVSTHSEALAIVGEDTSMNAMIDTVICPLCLCQVEAQIVRPKPPAYSEGVTCDRCGLHIECGLSDYQQTSVPFFHCGNCWYDLCQDCGSREMREVWWK